MASTPNETTGGIYGATALARVGSGVLTYTNCTVLYCISAKNARRELFAVRPNANMKINKPLMIKWTDQRVERLYSPAGWGGASGGAIKACNCSHRIMPYRIVLYCTVFAWRRFGGRRRETKMKLLQVMGLWHGNGMRGMARFF